MPKSHLKPASQHSAFSRMEKLHPYLTFLYLSMAGIALLFLFLIIAFQVTKSPDFVLSQFHFPKAFVVSTFVLLMSSFTVDSVGRYFKDGKTKAIRYSLMSTLALGLLFIFLQVLGWQELQQHGIYLQGKASGAYLYVISGLHIVHLAGGIAYLSLLTYAWAKGQKDGVKELVLITDPYQQLRLRLLVSYWHFMDVLWAALFFYFLFSL